MSKRAELPQSRRHVLIFDEDWEWLDARYGRYSDNKLGAGVAVRKLVHRAVRQLKEREQEAISQRASVASQQAVAGVGK